VASYEIRGFRAPAPWQTIECFVDYTLDPALYA